MHFRSLVLLACVSCLPATAQYQWSSGPARPIPRKSAKLAFDALRSRVVLVGGGADVAGTNWPQSDSWEYDGLSWARAAAQPASLETCGEHGLAFDEARGVAVMTCARNTGGPQETWEYDGTIWRQGPDLPVPPSIPVSLLAYDTTRARVLLVRAFSSSPTELFEYDGLSWVQSPVAVPLTAGSSYRSVTYDTFRGRLVVVDGNATWEFDGSQWFPAPAPPSGAVLGFGAYDASRGKTVVLVSVGFPVTLQTWEYDGASWFQSPAALPEPIAEGWSMTYDARRRRVVLFGGRDEQPPPATYYSNNTWEYDGSVWTRAAAAVPHAAVGHAMAYDAARDTVVLFGGARADGDLLAETWEHAALWRRGAVPPAGLLPRRDHAMAYDAGRGRVILFGGRGATSVLNDTWELDGNAWSPGPAAPAALVARSAHRMAYDALRARVVLFGGEDRLSVLLGDTWLYDGIGWTAGPSAPPALTPRSGHAMTYDAARQAVVLFGGNDGTDRKDTWLLAGGGWTAGAAAPPAMQARRLTAMGYDSAGGYVVLFGGSYDSAGNVVALNDTWLGDASGWAAGAPPAANLSPRQQHAAVHDALHGRLVVWGGLDGNDQKAFVETWELGSPRADYVVGAGQGPPNPNRWKVLDPSGLPTGVDVTAYAAGSWGIDVTSGDVDGSAPGDVVTAPGPGPTLGPQVRGFRAAGSAIGKINFFSYGTLKYGAATACAGTDGDLPSEIVTGPGPGTVFGPQARGWNFDGVGISTIAGINFYAYGTLAYGLNVAAGDVDGDLFQEILTTPGPGPTFAARVRGWNVDGAVAAPMGGLDFFAYASTQFGGRAASDDVDADGDAEVVTAPGPGALLAARFLGFDYTGTVAALVGFDVTPYGSRYGGRPGLGDVGGVPGADLLSSPGPDPAALSLVRPYAYGSGQGLLPLFGTTTVFGRSTFGADVAGGRLGF